jgi:hypothetical protein
VKGGIFGIKLKDNSFNNKSHLYREYLQNFEKGKVNVDKDWIMVDALATVTHRCIIIISSLERHKQQRE